MTFERSEDWELIKRIITHPRIYPWLSDDFSPKPEDWTPIEHPSIWYVLARDAEGVLGGWMLHPENGCCWKIHTAILPEARGERARQAVAELAPWIWDHIPSVERVNTDVPSFNDAALKFALAAGMKQFGINPKSFKKGGKLFDQILLGISRPGVN